MKTAAFIAGGFGAAIWVGPSSALVMVILQSDLSQNSSSACPLPSGAAETKLGRCLPERQEP